MIKNFLITSAIFLSLIGTSLASYYNPYVSRDVVPTTLFGTYATQDNGDSCLTPEEIHGVLAPFQEVELIKTYEGDDVVKFRNAVIKLFNVDEKNLFMFNKIEVYTDSTQPENYLVVLYSVDCKVVDFYESITEHDMILKEAFGEIPSIGTKPRFDISVPLKGLTKVY